MKYLAPLFCQRALDNSADLSTAERADFFDFAGGVLHRNGLEEQAEAAFQTATDLRNAEAAQVRFESLLAVALDTNKVR